MECLWKPNWEDTKDNFRKWWQRDGLLISAGGWCPESQSNVPHEQADKPEEKDLYTYYTDPDYRVAVNHHQMANANFMFDSLPVANANYGPGSLANFFDSEPDYTQETVWFLPTIQDVLEPEKLPSLKFDPENKWWEILEETLRKNAELAKGKYRLGVPDLVENIDVLASLRDPQTLLMDMIERPEWIEEKVMEINQVFFEAYDRIYDIIKGEDGSSIFWAFALWSQGKTAKVQCDTSAMFSPDMFKRFVVPALTEQCEWLDNSMYHLDGHQCICHLDNILEIDSLDAVEWTSDPTVPRGGDPCWYEMYKRILDAGKCVQVVMILPQEIKPLLDAVGPKGMYICTGTKNEADYEEISRILEEYRD